MTAASSARPLREGGGKSGVPKQQASLLLSQRRLVNARTAAKRGSAGLQSRPRGVVDMVIAPLCRAGRARTSDALPACRLPRVFSPWKTGRLRARARDDLAAPPRDREQPRLHRRAPRRAVALQQS